MKWIDIKDQPERSKREDLFEVCDQCNKKILETVSYWYALGKGYCETYCKCK